MKARIKLQRDIEQEQVTLRLHQGSISEGKGTLGERLLGLGGKQGASNENVAGMYIRWPNYGGQSPLFLRRLATLSQGRLHAVVIRHDKRDGSLLHPRELILLGDNSLPLRSEFHCLA